MGPEVLNANRESWRYLISSSILLFRLHIPLGNIKKKKSLLSIIQVHPNSIKRLNQRKLRACINGITYLIPRSQKQLRRIQGINCWYSRPLSTKMHRPQKVLRLRRTASYRKVSHHNHGGRTEVCRFYRARTFPRETARFIDLDPSDLFQSNIWNINRHILGLGESLQAESGK